MKKMNFKGLLLALTLAFVIQNGAIVFPNLPDDTYTDDGSISPCHDKPPLDDRVD